MTAADLIVVGSGLFGLTIAERAARERGMRVLVLEQRSHIGGNAYSETDVDTGIEIHRYGAHIFHTSNAAVWEYVNRFTGFTRYEHRVYSTHRGEVFPLPINLGTINQFFRAQHSPAEARALIASGTGIPSDDSLEAKAISLIGEPLYRAFIKEYTEKQWQTPVELLPADIITRLPIRYTYDNRYFDDTFQGMPVDGYTAWLERMLDHPLIEVRLGHDYLSAGPLTRDEVRDVPVVYTGPVDRYFDYSEGRLGWRTVDFDLQTLDVADHQGTAVMNFADAAVPHTRTIEFKHFHPERESFAAPRTVVAHEFSRAATAADEPYYPINTPDDRERLLRYRELMRGEAGVHFGGRLGTYKYLDMHMAIASALTLFSAEFAG